MKIGRIRTGERTIFAAVKDGKTVMLSELIGIDEDQLVSGFFAIYNENAELLKKRDFSGMGGIKPGSYGMDVPVVSIPNVRDFYAFEEHVRNGRRNRGLDMVPEWYEFPVFYFSNTSSVIPSGADVSFPPSSIQRDFEAEFAFVVKDECRNLTPEESLDSLLGVTCANDWSARDIQMKEVRVGLGPAKGKDFATSLGPWILTMDEVIPREENGRIDLPVTVRRNSSVYTEGNLKSMYWTVGDLLARASDSATLVPGDVIMTGTVGNGCLFEHGGGPDGWLKSGDVISIEIEGPGELVNRVM